MKTKRFFLVAGIAIVLSSSLVAHANSLMFTTTSLAGEVLTSNGSGNEPTFQALAIGPILTHFVKPILPTSIDTNQSGSFNVNTTASLGLFNVPQSITVNKISIKSGSTITTAGTYDLSVYSEDGQTQMFSVTTSTIDTADTIYSTSVSSVTLAPGNYWLMLNPNSTVDVALHSFSGPNAPVLGLTVGLLGDVSSEPAVSGTLTITASTPPATFTPINVTEGTSRLIVARFDN
ncbi:MAG TPA: hypothetical protein VJC14_00520 [Candidatus Paceibacterota bacterium]